MASFTPSMILGHLELLLLLRAMIQPSRNSSASSGVSNRKRRANGLNPSCTMLPPSPRSCRSGASTTFRPPGALFELADLPRLIAAAECPVLIRTPTHYTLYHTDSSVYVLVTLLRVRPTLLKRVKLPLWYNCVERSWGYAHRTPVVCAVVMLVGKLTSEGWRYVIALASYDTGFRVYVLSLRGAEGDCVGQSREHLPQPFAGLGAAPRRVPGVHHDHLVP